LGSGFERVTSEYKSEALAIESACSANPSQLQALYFTQATYYRVQYISSPAYYSLL